MTPEATASELRKTGISVIGDVRWGTHFCSFYEKKQDLLETLVPYFKAGLESKEFCVWVVSQALSVKEVKRALTKAVPDLARHLAEGDLEIHSNDEWYLRDGRWDPQRLLQSWREKLNQTSANGHAGLRASGDTGWIQSGDWMAFREYEEQVNALIAGQRSIILCTYPLTTSSGDQVFDVAHIHQVAVARRNGSWELIETPNLKEAKSEISRLNDELERKVEERTKELAATNRALRSEIAERRLAEEAVKQTEDRIRLVIDTIPTMVWSLRSDGVVDFVNQRWLRYTGLSFEDAITEPNRIVHPEDLSSVVETWLKDMSAGKPSQDEMRLRRGDGEYRWFLIRTVPLVNEQGDILKWYGAGTDIEDRKRAERQFRTLIDAIPHQIWSGPPDGTIDYCNERWRSYTGLELKDLQGNGWRTMLHPDDRDRVLKAWHESVVNETPYEQEERHHAADGTYRWFLARAFPLRDAEGRIVRWYGTNTDIEDRKRAEAALNAQVLRYKTLLETSTDSIYVVDEKGDLQEANAAFLRRRGYAITEVKGLNIADWDAQWSREQLQERLHKLVGGSAVFETRHRCKDGSVFDVEVCATSVQIGSEQLFLAVTRDITQRKQAEQAVRESEERFRELAENIDDFFWLTDLQHEKILYISPAYERIWGRTRASLLASQRSWREGLHPEDRERILAVLSDGHPRGTPGLTFRIVRPDGSVRWVHSREFPVKDADGEVVRVAGIVVDITERKRVELALDERLRFETLLTELSAAFASLPTTKVDQEIDKWLQNLVEFLDLDHATFDQMGDGATLSRSHSHTARGIDPAQLNVTNDQTPWITEQVLLGNTIKWSRIPDDIPKQAVKEKEFAARIGAKSVLSIPVWIGGSVICAISFTAMRSYREWPDEMVARLRLVGEIFANAIARKRAAKELEEANHQLRFLSRRLFHVQEEERRHLARELHDEVGQALTAAKINLQAAIKETDGAKSKRIDETAAILEKLLVQVRQISLDLRPSTLDDLGLVPALRALLDQQGRRASVAVRFSAKNVPENLNPEIQTTCFRIAQEAITNAVRHANATRIDVELARENGNLQLQVRDNGKGFDADAAQAQTAGLGLVGIKERAALVDARARIISSPNNGTTVEVSLPLMFLSERESREVGK
jgi:PAS domain S-box-containing protein